MTDGQLVKIMDRIYRLNEQARDLIDQTADHPNGAAICEDLYDEGFGYSFDFALNAHRFLQHPERWRYENGRLVWDP